MQELILPNKYKLDFKKHIGFSESAVNTNYFPVYFIPVLRTPEGEISPDLNHILVFRLDQIKYLPREDNFFEKYSYPSDEDLELMYQKNIPENYNDAMAMGYKFNTIMDISEYVDNKTMLEMAVNESLELFGYNDLVVGYFDENKNEFVQGLYIEDFHIKETFAILDYYMYTLENKLYLNEDMLDFKIKKEQEKMSKSLSFKLNTDSLFNVVKKLKLSCIEGSFNGSYREEFEEMNRDISYTLSNFIDNFDPDRDQAKIVELSNHLRVLNILEFYTIDGNSDNYIPIEKVLNNRAEGRTNHIVLDSLVIGFHPRLTSILNDKYF